MKSLSYLRASVFASAFFGMIGTASAVTTFTVDQQATSIFGANGSVNLTIFDDDYRSSGVNVLAGGFAVKADTDGNSVVENFTAWCLDITRSVNLPSLYSVTSAPFTNFLLSSNQKAAIQYLFDTALAGLNLASGLQSGGFQLALWEIVNEDTGTYNVKSGSFYSTGGSSAGDNTRNFANQLLAGLLGTKTGNFTLKYLESDRHYSQNLVTGQPSPVPVPAAGLLLLSALGGLGAIGRLKSRKAQPAG